MKIKTCIILLGVMAALIKSNTYAQSPDGKLNISAEQRKALGRRMEQVNDSMAVVRKLEQRQKDSINLAEITARRVKDSLIMVAQRYRADSIAKVSEDELAQNKKANKISLKKIEITGDGLLLEKGESHRLYSITQDQYNRYTLADKGSIGMRSILDVKKVIHDSELELLSDSLFHNIEINKVSIRISSNGRGVQRFGSLIFYITANINDISEIYENKNVLNLLLKAVSQVDDYIPSTERLYRERAYHVEPLAPNGFQVYIMDKKGTGASIGDIKFNCNKAKKSIY